MADVARLAGVSTQTVSRVINGHPSIRPATRSRVDDAIAQLGYRPNTVARALVTKRSSTIGVIARSTSHWGASALESAVQMTARRAGYFVTVAGLETSDQEELVEAIRRMRDHGVDAVAVIAPSRGNSDREWALRAEQGLPVVDVDSVMELSTGTDSCAGGRLATQHLLDLGHTDIAHVGGPSSWSEASARRRGWEQAMRAAHIPPSCFQQGDWTARSGYEAGLALARRRHFSAVFCANDQMALGLLRAMHEVGLRVPDDVSLIGHDDMPDSAQLQPPLTTIRQDLTGLAHNVVEVLQALMTGTHASPVWSPPQLRVRASTAPPQGSHGVSISMDGSSSSLLQSGDCQILDESR